MTGGGQERCTTSTSLAPLERARLNTLKQRIERRGLVVVHLVEFGGNRLFIVLLNIELQRDAVEMATRNAHSLCEVISRLENGIRNRDRCLHTCSMTVTS